MYTYTSMFVYMYLISLTMYLARVGGCFCLQAQVMDPPPTAGYAKEEFKKDNVHFTVVDMGGSGRYRALWEHYFEDCQGIVYVVDSSDKLRMCLSQDELQNILKHPQTNGKPLLVFANKMDLPAAMDAEEVAERLSLHKISDRPYTIVYVCSSHTSHTLTHSHSSTSHSSPIVGRMRFTK
jgi:small GTP-binding protein